MLRPRQPAPAPKRLKGDVTPAPVAETDVAATDPLLAFEPSTTTVSPTCSDPKPAAALRSTVALGPTVTFTRSPLALVT